MVRRGEERRGEEVRGRKEGPQFSGRGRR